MVARTEEHIQSKGLKALGDRFGHLSYLYYIFNAREVKVLITFNNMQDAVYFAGNGRRVQDVWFS